MSNFNTITQSNTTFSIQYVLKSVNNVMLKFKALKLPYGLIIIRLKIVNCKKFDAVPQIAGGQTWSESSH